MHWKAICLSALIILSGGLPVSRAQDATTDAPPTKKPIVKPTSKPADAPKPAATASNAVTPAKKDTPTHEKLLAEAKKGPYDLVLLGDSITRGWPNGGKSSYAKLAEYKPLDLGVSGDCTQHVLWRITNGELDGLKPKVLVLMIGTNNAGAGDQPEWTAAGVAKIVETVHEKLPDTKVLLLGIFPRDKKDSPKRKFVTAVNEIISKLGDDKKTFYLDIGDKFLDENGEISPKIMGDGLHPGPKGYDIWFDAMKPKLDELMK